MATTKTDTTQPTTPATGPVTVSSAAPTATKAEPSTTTATITTTTATTKEPAAPAKTESATKTDSKDVDTSRGSTWNVNSWHWEEKDLAKWARLRLPELINETKVVLPNGSEITISGVSRLDGDAFCNIRKGRRLYNFDYKCTINWEGKLKGADGKTVLRSGGTARLPSIADDVQNNEYEVANIVVDGRDPEHEQLRQFMCREGRTALRAQLAKFAEELRTK